MFVSYKFGAALFLAVRRSRSPSRVAELLSEQERRAVSAYVRPRVLSYLVKTQPGSAYIELTAAKTAFKRWGILRHSSLAGDADVLSTHIEELSARYDSILIGAHSLGGLVVISGLDRLLVKNNKATLRKIVGFFAFAVPFRGSPHAWSIAGLVSSDARALHAYNDEMRAAADRFEGQFRLELDKKLRMHNRVPTFALVASEDTWVPQSSARGSCPLSQISVFRKNHESICKAESADDPVVERLRLDVRAIHSLLLQPSPKAGSGEYVVRIAVPGDSAAIIGLGNHAFGAQAVGDDLLQQWINKNATAVYVLQRQTAEQEIVGYWCVLAIDQNTYNGLLHGVIAPKELDGDHVLSLENEMGFYYVGGIVAVGKKPRAQIVRGFEDFIRQKAALEQARSGGRIWVLARAATMDGLRMIRRNAFNLAHGPDGLGGLFQRQF